LQPGCWTFGFIQVDCGALVPSYGSTVRGLPLDAIVRVHPTPIYEFVIAIVIFWILWRLGERAYRTNAPNGIVFAAYLVLTGIARYLIEIIRINPRTFHGLTNAQAASVVSIIAGVILFMSARRHSAEPRRA
jgi:phosphatidylglycerol:prolipoprotein diacylglycerol transferase